MRARPQSIKTIIFDWTGVVMNEFQAIYMAHSQTITALGGRSETYEHFLRNIRADWRIYYRQCGVESSLLGHAFSIFRRYLDQHLDLMRPYDGAAEVLRDLSTQGFRLAVVSGQARRAVLHAAKTYGLLQYFTLIIGAEDAREAKPSAEPLRLALRMLKARPTETLYVEDMEEGIRVGHEVGVLTLGVKSELGQDLSRADLTVDSIRALPSVLAGGVLSAAMGRDPVLATAEQKAQIDGRYQEKLRGLVTRILSWYHADNRALANRIVDWETIERGSRVADIGCGLSAYLDDLVASVGCRGIAVDLSFVALSAARRNAHHEPMSFVCGDIAALPFRDGAFDAIICSEMLEHVSDELEAIAEVSRLLRPGGAVIISVPNTVAGTALLFRSLQMEFNLAGHVREFEAVELRSALDNAGLDTVELHTSSFFLYWLVFSIDRSRFAKSWMRFFARHPRIEQRLKAALAAGICKENQLLRRVSDGGMCQVVLARKRTVPPSSEP